MDLKSKKKRKERSPMVSEGKKFQMTLKQILGLSSHFQKDSFKMPPPKDLMFDAKLIPYVPKNVVEQQIRMINQQHHEKIKQFKNYVQQMKQEYQDYEQKSQEYYKEIIEDQKKRSTDKIKYLEEQLRQAENIRDLQHEEINNIKIVKNEFKTGLEDKTEKLQLKEEQYQKLEEDAKKDKDEAEIKINNLFDEVQQHQKDLEERKEKITKLQAWGDENEQQKEELFKNKSMLEEQVQKQQADFENEKKNMFEDNEAVILQKNQKIEQLEKEFEQQQQQLQSDFAKKEAELQADLDNKDMMVQRQLTLMPKLANMDEEQIKKILEDPNIPLEEKQNQILSIAQPQPPMVIEGQKVEVAKGGKQIKNAKGEVMVDVSNMTAQEIQESGKLPQGVSIGTDPEGKPVIVEQQKPQLKVMPNGQKQIFTEDGKAVQTTTDAKGNHIGITTDENGNKIGVGTDQYGNPIPVMIVEDENGQPKAVAIGPSSQVQEAQAKKAQANAMAQAQQVSRHLEEIGINTDPVTFGTHMGKSPSGMQPASGPHDDIMFEEEFVEDVERAMPGQLVKGADGQIMVKDENGQLKPATQQQIQEAKQKQQQIQQQQRQMHGAGMQSMAIGSSSAGMQSMAVGQNAAGLQVQTDQMNSGIQTIDPKTGQPIQGIGVGVSANLSVPGPQGQMPPIQLKEGQTIGKDRIVRDKKGRIVTDETGQPLRVPLKQPVEMEDPQLSGREGAGRKGREFDFDDFDRMPPATFVDYERIRKQKDRLKGDIEKWYKEFEDQTKRRPRATDCPPEVIKKLERFNEINQEYSRIKYSLQKQGLVRKDLGNFREGAQKIGQKGQKGKAGVKQNLRDLAGARSGAPRDQQQDMTVPFEQAIRERDQLQEEVELLKDQMHRKEGFNSDLSDEIQQLQQMLKEAHQESAVIKEVSDQLKEKSALLSKKDQQVHLLEQDNQKLNNEKEYFDWELRKLREDFAKFREAALGDEDSEMILRQQLLRLTYESDQYKRACERLKEQLKRQKEWVVGGMSTNRSLHQGQKPPENKEETQNLVELSNIGGQESRVLEETKTLHPSGSTQKLQQQPPMHYIERVAEHMRDNIEAVKDEKLIQQAVNTLSEEQNAALHRRIHDLITQNQEKQHKIQELLKDLESLKKGAAHLGNEMGDAHNSMQQELALKQEMLVRIEDKLVAEEQKTKEFKRENYRLKKELEGKQNEAGAELKKINDEYQRRIFALEKEKDVLEREKNKQNEQGANQNKNLKDKFDKERNDLLAKIDRVEIEKKEAIDAYMLQIEKVENHRVALQDQINQLEIIMEKQQKDGEERADRLRELETKNAQQEDMKEEFNEMKYKLKTAMEDKLIMVNKYKMEQFKRKQLHNQMEDIKGSIRVYARIRPLTQAEQSDPEKSKIVVNAEDDFSITVETKNGKKTFNFDSCFNPDTTQEQVYEETSRLMQSAVDGYNVCIFAYGQTGSGKTHTIQGNEQLPGITPRAINEIFEIINSMDNYNIQVKSYMVELYLNELRDLLLHKNAQRENLEIKELLGMVRIAGVTERPVANSKEAYDIFQYGMQQRKTRKTLMNDASSRSHLIFSLILESENRQTGQRTVGKISFVDLAGSEKLNKTQVNKEGAQEAKAINASLSALGNVINALSQNSAHIPYRDHPLTLLMRDSLGGTAKTLMFVNLSPSIYNASESNNSLEYASRVKKIKNKVNRNVESREVTELKKRLANIEDMLAACGTAMGEHGIGDKYAQITHQ